MIDEEGSIEYVTRVWISIERFDFIMTIKPVFDHLLAQPAIYNNNEIVCIASIGV